MFKKKVALARLFYPLPVVCDAVAILKVQKTGN